MSYAGESAGVTESIAPGLLDQVRLKHHSARTDQAHVGWIEVASLID